MTAATVVKKDMKEITEVRSHKNRTVRQFTGSRTDVKFKNHRSSTEILLNEKRCDLKMDKKCFNCSKKGHYANKWPMPKRECSICKQMGHEDNHCFRKEKKCS